MRRGTRVSENNVVFLSEKFENEKSGELIDGITIMIDGKLKTMLDILMEKEKIYNSYAEIIKDLVFDGINRLVEKHK